MRQFDYVHGFPNLNYHGNFFPLPCADAMRSTCIWCRSNDERANNGFSFVDYTTVPEPLTSSYRQYPVPQNHKLYRINPVLGDILRCVYISQYPFSWTCSFVVESQSFRFNCQNEIDNICFLNVTHLCVCCKIS